MKKVFIATARSVGEQCRNWALKNTPKDYQIVDNIGDCDILISVMYDKILKPQFLENKRSYNIHPGILPDYRGVGISSWVLINEESKTGITLHKIDSGVDTGKVIEIREILISEQDTAHTLFERTEHLILKMFKNWYVDLLEENYTAVSQKKNNKIYLKKDLQKAKNLTKFVKAFHFPGKENAYYYNRELEKVYLKF